jgi:RNA polymerase sigma factor (sigma-70 family)
MQAIYDRRGNDEGDVMATTRLRHVIQTLRGATLHEPEACLSDGQLLDRYVRGREEGAFAALVQRHGPMVWGVCRRVVSRYQDAEDAFQATFLVLVRKASSVVPREMVANWLYGVAHRTALKARALAARRGARERQVTAMPETGTGENRIRDDLNGLLDQELSRLPDKYRAVIVLCDLQGKTRKEAARHVNAPEGTVASRLNTARAMLAKRLARHGLTLSGAALAAALAQSASAGVPGAAAASTIRAAALFAAGQTAAVGVISTQAVLLAEGVIKAMLLTKLKIAVATLALVAALGVGATMLTQQVLAEKPAEPANPERERPEQKPVRAAQAADEPPTPKKQLNEPPVKKKDADPLPTVVSGIVKAVDPANRAFTVTERGVDTVVGVARDAEIQIDGKAGEFAAVPLGASIHLRQFVDATTARSVQVEGRWLWGTVKAVDAANNTITVGTPDGAAGKAYIVPNQMIVTIDGKVGKLAAIPAGASVNLQLFADQTTVRSLAVEGAPINGIAKAVDVVNRTITVNETTYPVPAEANVSIDHKPGKLEGLPVGANVSLSLRVDQKTVGRISAAGGADFGQVKAVDAVKSTITVTGGPPNDRVYVVPPDAPIVIDGKPGKLAEIPVGAGLHALNLRADQRTVSGINVVGPSLHHVGVKAVDAENRTVTLDESAPREFVGKTLRVAPSANVEIDGKPGKLVAIPAGAFVNLGLTVDAGTALNVQAGGPGLGGCGGSCASAIDAVNDTITFDEKGPPEVAGKMFRVAKDVGVQIDARPGKLAEVPAGSYLNITLTVDRQTVRSVWAVGPPVPGLGVVKAVDVEKRTITVDDRTYPVASNANVIIDNRGGLGAVPIGASVSLRLCVDQKTVGTIAVQAK